MDKKLQFFLQMQKVNNNVTRRFDRGLSGLGFNEFAILLHLNQSESGSMSCVALAEALGLTASAITRILGPMEKVGYIKRAPHEQDKRISLISIARGGTAYLENSMENALDLSDTMLPKEVLKESSISDAMTTLSNSLK